MTDDNRNIATAREQEEARRVDDDYLSDLQRLWQAASKGPWRVEKQRDGDRHKLYAVSPPNTHDAYLLDLSAGDAKYAANLDAIAKAPEHVAALLAEVKRLRHQRDCLLKETNRLHAGIRDAANEIRYPQDRASADIEALARKLLALNDEDLPGMVESDDDSDD